MSSFTDPLKFIKVNINRKSGAAQILAVTEDRFRFYLDDSRDGWYCEIPIGFRSNGASIPVWIQKAFNWDPFDIRWAQAAFLHDALVGETCERFVVFNDKYPTGKQLSWADAATWFDKALQVKRDNATQECPPLNRRLFVAAVRLHGVLKGKQ